MGFTKVTNVHGGLMAWKKAGLPVKQERAGRPGRPALCPSARHARRSDASAAAGADAHVTVLDEHRHDHSCRR